MLLRGTYPSTNSPHPHSPSADLKVLMMRNAGLGRKVLQALVGPI
jgi:hypothetical protein